MAEKIYDPQFLPTPAEQEAMADFVAIVRQLRRDCPWDREQTHDSVKHMLIEEAYEVVEAIDQEDWDELKQELGDILLQVVFHAAMAEPAGSFTLKQIVEAESEKLVRRHPHVFGDAVVASVDDVLTNWEHIKKTEGKRTSTLDGVPAELPALMRAYRVQEKAAAVGFDFPDRHETWGKVEEEIGELRDLVEQGAAPADLEAEFGDLVFALVNYARFVGVKPENALRRTNAKFSRRFRHVEQRLNEQGFQFEEVTLEEMDRYWDEAKNLEKEAD